VAAYNKVVLASEMFVEAHEKFTAAARDVDYVVSLMLSGAVVGVIAPLLNEQGKPSMHQLLARLSNIAEPDGEPAHAGLFRAVYNGLKHAGNPRKRVAASADLSLNADFRLEAAELLEAPREDFTKILVTSEVRAQLSPRFVTLLAPSVDYAQPYGQADAPVHAFFLTSVGTARRLPPTLGLRDDAIRSAQHHRVLLGRSH
jgi:hypothetical protein